MQQEGEHTSSTNEHHLLSQKLLTKLVSFIWRTLCVWILNCGLCNSQLKVSHGRKKPISASGIGELVKKKHTHTLYSYLLFDHTKELVMTNKCEIHLLLVKWHQGHFDLQGGDFFFFFLKWWWYHDPSRERALPWLSGKICPCVTHCFLSSLKYRNALLLQQAPSDVS